MPAQVAHIVVNIYLILSQRVYLCPEPVNVLGAVWILLSDFSLMGFELCPHMVKQFFEVF